MTTQPPAVDLGGGLYRSRVAAELDAGAYIEGKYRLLSACYLPSLAVEIPPEVLRAAVPLWAPRPDPQGIPRPLTVYADHDASVRSWVGQVVEAHWSDATDTRPAGVDGQIRVDRLADPRVARGVETGVIRAVSSGWEMTWRQSHDIPAGDFWARLGTDGPDGTPVRRIATEITDVLEVSLVWDGADPYAKRLDATRAARPVEGAMDPELTPETKPVDERAQTPPEAPPPDPEEEAPPPSPMAQLRELLGLTDEPDSALVDRVRQLLDQRRGEDEAQAAEVVAVRAAREQAAGEVTALRAELARRDREAVLDAAVREGRCTPAERAALDALALVDLSGVQALLAARAPGSAVPLGVQAAGAGPGSGGLRLTEDQRKIAKSLGISEDLYQRQLAADLARREGR